MLPERILKNYIIEEDVDNRGNRLYLIKRKISGIPTRFISDDIPLRYQQNNSLDEAESSLFRYLTLEVGIVPRLINKNNRIFSINKNLFYPFWFRFPKST